MILIAHIIIACSSLIFTGFLLISPSNLKLNISYGLVALTIISGFTLILTKPASMTQTCISGLSYLFIISLAIIYVRRKLASKV